MYNIAVTSLQHVIQKSHAMNPKIKELAEIQMGYAFRTRLDISACGNLSVIQMKDLHDDNTVHCDELVKVEMKSIKENHLVKKGDLVFRSRSLTTTSAILRENPGKAIVAAPLLRIRIQRPGLVLPEYLNWYINQEDAQRFLASRTEGTLQRMISTQALGELIVSLPPLAKQKHIVALAMLSDREAFLLHELAIKRKNYISMKLMQFAKGE